MQTIYRSILSFFPDVDECIGHQHNCNSTDHQICKNKAGGFECSCEQGYFLINGKCLSGESNGCILSSSFGFLRYNNIITS